MTTALLVYAHLDDELLWGHPFLLDRSLDRRVLICSSDRTNPSRQSYARGEEAFAAVCKAVGVTEYRVLPYWSEFYRLRTRGPGDGPTLKDWWTAAQSAVSEMMQGCDFIASHNEVSEYGHLDHALVRRMVMETDNRPPLKWTGAMVETSTWPIGSWRVWSEDTERIAWTDSEEFARLKHEYWSRGCWTWSSDEPLNVGVIRERA